MQVDEVGNKAVVHLDGDKIWMSQHRMNNPKDTDDEGISTEEEEESATVRLENRPKKKTTGRKVGDDEVVVKKAWVEDVPLVSSRPRLQSSAKLLVLMFLLLEFLPGQSFQSWILKMKNISVPFVKGNAIPTLH